MGDKQTMSPADKNPPVPASLPEGTRIVFLKSLTVPANEDHPAFIYAEKGELGNIVGYGCAEGYWVTADRCVHAFGATLNDEFAVVSPIGDNSVAG